MFYKIRFGNILLLNDEINWDYLKLQRKVDLSFVAFETIENEFIEFYKETMEI